MRGPPREEKRNGPHCEWFENSPAESVFWLPNRGDSREHSRRLASDGHVVVREKTISTVSNSTLDNVNVDALPREAIG